MEVNDNDARLIIERIKNAGKSKQRAPIVSMHFYGYAFLDMLVFFAIAAWIVRKRNRSFLAGKLFLET